MFFIRQARDEDNQALLNLEKMCPQGTGLVLLFDRSPDFFLRSKMHGNYRVYVAEEEAKIVGTVGTTVKEVDVNGKKIKAIYVYDLRVRPDCRGKGLGASLVRQALEKDDQAQLAYGIIMEENNPSIALFRKMGFQKIHDITTLNLPLYERETRTTHKIRTMTAEDVPRVVELINDRYRDYSFFSPLSATDFLDRMKQLPGYGLEKVQIIEMGNRIVACAGLWDYSEVFRISALRVSMKMKWLAYLLRFVNLFKKTMRLPLVGEPFRLMYVRDFAFTDDTDSLEDLVEHCLNLAHHHGCNFLSFDLDPADSAIFLLAKYKPIKTTFHIYARSLEGKDLSIPTKMYIDPADL